MTETRTTSNGWLITLQEGIPGEFNIIIDRANNNENWKYDGYDLEEQETNGVTTFFINIKATLGEGNKALKILKKADHDSESNEQGPSNGVVQVIESSGDSGHSRPVRTSGNISKPRDKDILPIAK